MKNIIYLSILFLLSASCSGSESTRFLGCDWNIPESFKERGGDEISKNSWSYLGGGQYKSITFEKINFNYDGYMKEYSYLGESTLSGLYVYDFKSVDEEVNSQISIKIITKDNSNFISLYNFTDHDYKEFSKNCR